MGRATSDTERPHGRTRLCDDFWRKMLSCRENLNGHRYMVTGNFQKTISKKLPDRFRIFSPAFVCFRPFLHFFPRLRTLWAICFWLFLAVRFFGLFRTIRLLPFNGCHLASPDLGPTCEQN